MGATPRLVAANSSIAIQTQGYTQGKTRGATILYGIPQVGNSLSPSSNWLQVVTGTGNNGTIIGNGRKPNSRPSLGWSSVSGLQNQRMTTAISATASQLYTGGAGIQSSMVNPVASGTPIDFGVVRAGHYIIMGANVSATTGGVSVSTYQLANNVNANAVLGGASDSKRESIHYRRGGNATHPKLYLLALTYSGGSLDVNNFTFPVFTTQYTDGLVLQLGSAPSGTNIAYSGVAGLSGLVNSESGTVVQDIWIERTNAAATAATLAPTIASNPTGVTSSTAGDLALPILKIPGRICFSINGKTPIMQTYSTGPGMGNMTEDTVW